MLFVMTVALMPLGLIALFASVQSAAAKRLQHVADARIVAAAEARQIDLTVLRSANILRLAAASAAAQPARCHALVAAAQRAIGLEATAALFDARGRRLCASSDAALAGTASARGAIGAELQIVAGGLAVNVRAPDGAFAVGTLSRGGLAGTLGLDQRQGVTLEQGKARLDLGVPKQERALDRRIVVAAPVGGGQLRLIATSSANAISAIEVLLVLLPLLMWAAAAVIGWIVVNELLLRPLGQLQRAVARTGAEGDFALPRLSTPAREIRELGDAFAHATGQIAAREHDLSLALEHQVKLTREVHHRVKNNLQVVASLINLHARGSVGEVAAAYASIQRRVDALAIVHRNHYAELEENRGVALRALVAELTGNLRATAPPSAGQLAITLDMNAAHVTQDVAVPVAFLVTEIVELVMECGPNGAIEVGLGASPTPDRAILSIGAPALTRPACVEHPTRERFDRIIAGLARQLRAPLAIDADAGRYSISIGIFSGERKNGAA